MGYHWREILLKLTNIYYRRQSMKRDGTMIASGYDAELAVGVSLARFQQYIRSISYFRFNLIKKISGAGRARIGRVSLLMLPQHADQSQNRGVKG
jgi:hypothetical protein